MTIDRWEPLRSTSKEIDSNISTASRSNDDELLDLEKANHLAMRHEVGRSSVFGQRGDDENIRVTFETISYEVMK
jgi:hypothetical protein